MAAIPPIKFCTCIDCGGLTHASVSGRCDVCACLEQIKFETFLKLLEDRMINSVKIPMNKNTLNYSAVCPFCGEAYGHTCKETINPGDGYRWLRAGEMIKPGDEVLSNSGAWFTTAVRNERESYPADNGSTFRRRIDQPANGANRKPVDEMIRESSGQPLHHENGCAVFKSAKCDCGLSAKLPSSQPLFERRALGTINRVTATFGQRGTEYGDTMKDCQWLTLLATAKRLGIPLTKEHARAIAIAGMVDIKYQRMQGGYKDDNIVDGIAYASFHADEMKELLGGVK